MEGQSPSPISKKEGVKNFEKGEKMTSGKKNGRKMKKKSKKIRKSRQKMGKNTPFWMKFWFFDPKVFKISERLRANKAGPSSDFRPLLRCAFKQTERIVIKSLFSSTAITKEYVDNQKLELSQAISKQKQAEEMIKQLNHKLKSYEQGKKVIILFDYSSMPWNKHFSYFLNLQILNIFSSGSSATNQKLSQQFVWPRRQNTTLPQTQSFE